MKSDTGLGAENLRDEVAALRKEKGAVILAHTYQPAEVQDCADYVGDSYGLSQEARRARAERIVFCGVRFMAETAALLNPASAVILAEPRAGCPMADMIAAPQLRRLKTRYPDHLVVCYVNSTAEIKALSDVCVTSANAVEIVRRLPPERGILFVPDRHLGDWIREQTGRDMVLWNGLCPTHLRIRPDMIRAAREAHPGAEVLIHPEAARECRALADAVLSTGGMLRRAAGSGAGEFIIATETGILHTLRKHNPGKRFYPVSEEVVCPNMKRGSLLSVRRALDGTGGERITVPPEVALGALRALERMLELGREETIAPAGGKPLV